MGCLVAGMSAETWQPTDPPVDRECDGCGRGLPTYLRTREETMALHLGPLPGREASTDDRTYCGHCAAEVTDLTGSMEPAGEPGFPTTWGDLQAAETCALCKHEVDAPERVLSVGWRGAVLGSQDRYPVCHRCDDIVLEFLKNIPVEAPAGDLFYGTAPDVRVTVDEADPGDLLSVYEDLAVGADVRVESHVEAGEATPAAYHVVDGTVVHHERTMGIEDYVVEADGERYRLTRPAPTVDQLTLRREAPEAPEHLGQVTVLEAESVPEADEEAAAEEPVAAEGVVELDADSALVPDSIDLGSSAD